MPNDRLGRTLFVVGIVLAALAFTLELVLHRGGGWMAIGLPAVGIVALALLCAGAWRARRT